jgi:hypothetical protein
LHHASGLIGTASRDASSLGRVIPGPLGNITIRNSYNADSGEWKETASFTRTDFAVVSQLAGQAFQEIVQLKQQCRSRG